MTRILPEHWRPHGVDDLEPRAWDALREVAQSVCVTAGAGAGKTEFLAQKGSYLLETGLCPAPKRILAISFKRDAARNLSERISSRCPPEQARRFVSMTFDAFTKHLVDQFRDAIPTDYRPPADYGIALGTRDQLNDFSRRHGYNVSSDTLERAIARARLPIADLDIKSAGKEILSAYWRDQYESFDPSVLTFAMMNRLADLLVRRNPFVRRGLQTTYPFVFLDEFQDTTDPQFQMLKAAFKGGSTLFTAVGDDKQRIMGWAGAMENAFEMFSQTYAVDRRAKRTPLAG